MMDVGKKKKAQLKLFKLKLAVRTNSNNELRCDVMSFATLQQVHAHLLSLCLSITSNQRGYLIEMSQNDIDLYLVYYT